VKKGAADMAVRNARSWTSSESHVVCREKEAFNFLLQQSQQLISYSG
jgi:hypothetical protein